MHRRLVCFYRIRALHDLCKLAYPQTANEHRTESSLCRIQNLDPGFRDHGSDLRAGNVLGREPKSITEEK